ncbi:MAG: ABC transporter substrate-binding protein [Candidatus Altiarchaeota archaeon]|nr:ABC transporter substrate-binding protein [Candidatus Altiarchaeota archaeon]
MKKTKKIYILIFLAVVVSLFYLSWSQNTPTGAFIGTKDEPVRISLLTYTGYAPFYLAKELSFFEKEGVNVELIRIDDIGEGRAALKSKRVDAAPMTLDMMIAAADAGVPCTAVSMVDRSLGADGIVTTNEITKVEDLQGKKIALQRGYPSYTLMLYLLQNKGMKTDDIEIIEMNGEDAAATFIARKIDAAGTWEPWLSKATSRKNTHVLISSRDEPGIISDVLVFNSEFVKERPDEVRAIMRAWFDAIEYWEEHKEESNRIMADAYDLSLDDFIIMTEGVEWSDYNMSQEYFRTDVECKICEIKKTIEKAYINEGVISGNSLARIDSSFMKGLYTL